MKMASKTLSLETPPVELFDTNPLEAFYPLTPGQAPEDVVFDLCNEDHYKFTPLPPTQIQAPDKAKRVVSKGGVAMSNMYTFPVVSPSVESATPLVTHITNRVAPLVGNIINRETPSQNMDGKDMITFKKRRTRTKDKVTDPNVKQTTRALQYAPCFVCHGSASGDHYGVNTCEACKGFFRRSLLREKGAYQCKKGGHCDVIHTIKGICAGCRLKKCLDLGMAKEKCKLGRYSSKKRTEKIMTAQELNAASAVSSRVNPNIDSQKYNFISLNSPCQDSASQEEILSRTLSQLDISADCQNTFCDDLVNKMVQAKDDMKPFDKDKSLSNKEIKARIKEYHDHFTLKVKIYGEMKTVPKEEFSKLYGDFGIDVDDRMKELKQVTDTIDRQMKCYCSFVKHIPYFSKLSFKDQSNLLKVNRVDFYTTLLSQGYDPDLQVFLYSDRAYHMTEMDKFFSKDLVKETMSGYVRCQKLQLNDKEQSVLMGLCLFSPDRCSLENSNLVEMIQLSLAQMLRRELEKSCQESARFRFTKIIDYLISLRETGENYFKEYEDLCQDDLYVNECPVLTDFLFDT